MTMFDDPATWLPVAFAALMGTAILFYVILDGFDLGVGILTPLGDGPDRDRMIASIGPYWDANETWLVLATGLLLVAFPKAHGVILTALYLPVAIMLVGLILRGVAFEFRAKAPVGNKVYWDRAFFAGSLMTSLSQGYMLGLYIMGLELTWATFAFAILTAVGLVGAYALIGATWLIVKLDGPLKMRAIAWSRMAMLGAVAGLAAISITSPLVSDRIFAKWFSVPEIFILAPLPLVSALLLGVLWISLANLKSDDHGWDFVPFVATAVLFVLAFCGLAYSFYPYVVPEKLTIYEAASAPDSLLIILVGTLFVMPVILGYTVLAYYVFRGKAGELRYD